MGRLLVARLAQSLAVIAIVATLTFALIRLAPGDPFAYDNPKITQEVRDAWRARRGYDQPLLVQYGRYLGNIAVGRLGVSTATNRDVTTEIAQALPQTVLLATVSLVLSLGLGIGLGAWQAARRGGWFDRVTSMVLGAIYSIPDFALALLLLFVFAQWRHVLPAGGLIDPVYHEYYSFAGKVGDVLLHLALPALTLTLLATAIVARYQRSALIEVLSLDFVRTARAKGVRERTVIGRHALRNALASVIALTGLLAPALLGGAFFIEYVFAWPGMGTLLFSAISARDYDLVTGGVIVAAVMVTLGNLGADLLHAAVDPRLRIR